MELKEVLHFYLGCEIVADGSRLILSGIGVDGWVAKSKDESHRVSSKWGHYEIKPLLRPLSDMTEEEYNAMWELLGWNERITGNRRAEEIIREFAPIEIDDEQINNAHWGYFIKIMPYMLSRGFDLFDLINSNQAIDKTKGE